ncbi:MAG: hypothetical protein AAFO17_15895, partial [Pseudomonadota bacterium]
MSQPFLFPLSANFRFFDSGFSSASFIDYTLSDFERVEISDGIFQIQRVNFIERENNISFFAGINENILTPAN